MLPDRYRWTLGEYVLRCCVDSSLRELLVESQLDTLFWTEVLARLGATDVAVCDSDYLAVSDSDVARAGFTPGVKGRVLTVARALALASHGTALVANVHAVVDRDFDGVPSGLEAFLVGTDGYSIENYSIGAASVERFFARHFGRVIDRVGAAGNARMRAGTVTGQEVVQRLLPASVAITAVRKTLLSRHEGVGVIGGWSRRFKVDCNGYFAVDAAKLLGDSIRAGGGDFSSGDVSELAVQRTSISGGARARVRGHDFTVLFLALLRTRWGRTAAGKAIGAVDHEDFERWVVLATAPQDVDGEPAARRLREWFADVAAGCPGATVG